MNIMFLFAAGVVGWMGWIWVKDSEPRGHIYASRWRQKLTMPVDQEILLSIGKQVYQLIGTVWLGLAFIYAVLGLLGPMILIPWPVLETHPDPLRGLATAIFGDLFIMVVGPSVLTGTMIYMGSALWVRTSLSVTTKKIPTEDRVHSIPGKKFILPWWLMGLPLVTLFPIIWIWIQLWISSGWELVLYSWWGITSAGTLIWLTYLLVILSRWDPLYSSGWISWVRTPARLRGFIISISLWNLLVWLPPAIQSHLWLTTEEITPWPLLFTIGGAIVALLPLLKALVEEQETIPSMVDH